FHNVVLVRREDGAVLIEERPHKGLWAGMWQAPTLEHDERAATARELADWLGVRRLEPAISFEHQTSHRLVQFAVWRGSPPARGVPKRGAWVDETRLSRLPMSSAQRRILLKDPGS
ncbi:MAG: NUDIX domain-containing protein, partial [Planctomycetota bacterium]|nr:NUDIX domain-containing protein [Planctomycetota bacterium]